ncbi:MAG: hypothetical protein KF777_21820 [Planctomycetaceae bacterium]|nr:hypothetical protein [Planctomycetaceae bacterium]
MIRSSMVLGWVVVSTAWFSIGCGGGGSKQLPVVTVKGTVFVDDKPFGPGQLTLTPQNGGEQDLRPIIGGTIKADGSYVLTTYNTGDGAPVGEYSAVLGSGEAPKAGSTDPAEMMAAISGGGSKTDTIKVTVPDGGTETLAMKFSSTGSAGKPQPKNAPLGATQTK